MAIERACGAVSPEVQAERERFVAFLEAEAAAAPAHLLNPVVVIRGLVWKARDWWKREASA